MSNISNDSHQIWEQGAPRFFSNDASVIWGPSRTPDETHQEGLMSPDEIKEQDELCLAENRFDARGSASKKNVHHRI